MRYAFRPANCYIFINLKLGGFEMTEQQVIDLMKSSTNEQEWNKNADEVKKACGGYPFFWFASIVTSGVMAETQASWT